MQKLRRVRTLARIADRHSENAPSIVCARYRVRDDACTGHARSIRAMHPARVLEKRGRRPTLPATSAPRIRARLGITSGTAVDGQNALVARHSPDKIAAPEIFFDNPRHVCARREDDRATRTRRRPTRAARVDAPAPLAAPPTGGAGLHPASDRDGARSKHKIGGPRAAPRCSPGS